MRFFPAVEGARAVAAVAVLLVHVAFVSGLTVSSGAVGDFTARSEIGVGVFFVISGFLLYRPWARAHLTGAEPPALGRYLKRRLLRIVPLYSVVLLATLILVPAARPKDALDAVLLLLFGQVYRGQTVFLGVPQAWSLDIEMAFYLALPVYAAVMLRVGARLGSAQRAEWWGIGSLYAAGLGLRVLLEATSPVPWKVWHGFLPVWSDLFALGFALAVLSVRWERAPATRRVGRPLGVLACWSVAALAYLVLARVVGLGRGPLYERSTGQALAEELLWGLFAVALLLPAVAGSPRPLRARPVALLGLISYGVYLWHQLVVQMLLQHTGWHLFRIPFGTFFVAVLALTVLLATLSYRLVERPGIALGRAPMQKRRERLAGVSPADG